MEKFKEYFKKVCTNQFHTTTLDGKLLWYRHPDLYKMAKEAYEKGEKYFYADETKTGLVPAEPHYKYVAHISLTEEEYNQLFKG